MNGKRALLVRWFKVLIGANEGNGLGMVIGVGALASAVLGIVQILDGYSYGVVFLVLALLLALLAVRDIRRGNL